jgi:hypothetical protein
MVTNPQGVTKFGAVQRLSLNMGAHGPEPFKLFSRDIKTKLRDIAFKKCPDKIQSPLKTFGITI